MSLTDVKKRDFVGQIIELVTTESEKLSSEGYSPDSKIEELKTLKQACDQAEIQQQEAIARSREATSKAQESLDIAYKAASNMSDAISGILGKESEIVKRMKKFRY